MRGKKENQKSYKALHIADRKDEFLNDWNIFRDKYGLGQTRGVIMALRYFMDHYSEILKTI